MKVWWVLYDGWWVVHIRGRLQVILLSQYYEGVHSYTCNARVEGGTRSLPATPHRLQHLINPKWLRGVKICQTLGYWIPQTTFGQ